MLVTDEVVRKLRREILRRRENSVRVYARENKNILDFHINDTTPLYNLYL